MCLRFLKVLLVILFASLAVQAQPKAQLVITDDENNHWVKVFYVGNSVYFKECEGEKNNCHPMYDGRVFSRDGLEQQLISLQEAEDEEVVSSAIVGGVSFFVTFGLTTLGKFAHHHLTGRRLFSHKAQAIKILGINTGVSFAVSSALAVVHHIFWSPSGELVDALEEIKPPANEDSMLVVVNDIDSFIADLNDSLTPLL